MKILVITNCGIGDQIQFSSLIAGLKNKFNDSEITIFCHNDLKFIYEYDENVKTVTSEINDEEFDIGYNFALKNDLLDIFQEISINERVGFSRRRGFETRTKNAIIKEQRGIKATNSSARKLMLILLTKKRSDKLLSEWLCEIANVQWTKPYFTYDKTVSLPVLEQKHNIVIQYGTNIEEKNWSDENYEKLIGLIDPEITIWITAKENPKEFISRLEKYEYKNVFFFINKSFSEIASLLTKSDLIISPDTSIAQVGLALNVNTIVLSSKYDRGFTLSKKINNLILIEKETINEISPNDIIEKLHDIEYLPV